MKALIVRSEKKMEARNKTAQDNVSERPGRLYACTRFCVFLFLPSIEHRCLHERPPAPGFAPLSLFARLFACCFDTNSLKYPAPRVSSFQFQAFLHTNPGATSEIARRGSIARKDYKNRMRAAEQRQMKLEMAEEKQAEDDLQQQLLAVSKYATQATIAASTVFYNVATLDTDILNPFPGFGKPGPVTAGSGGWDPDDNTAAFTPAWTDLFLSFNLMVFASGITALFLSVVVNASLSKCKNADEKRMMAAAMPPLYTLIVLFSQISHWSLYGVLASLGGAKYNGKFKYHTVGIAVLGFLIMGYGKSQVYLAKKDALRTPPPDKDRRSRSVSASTPELIPLHVVMLDQFGFYGARASFFGTLFGYNALVFFYEYDRGVSELYVVLMSLSMIFALCLSSWNTSYVITLISLQPHQKEAFALQLECFFSQAWPMMMWSITTFCLGFSLFGYIKNKGTVGFANPRWFIEEGLHHLMTTAGLGTVVVLFHSWRLISSAHAAVMGINWSAAEKAHHFYRRDSNGELLRDKDMSKSLVNLCNSIADQTTFVAGNVFFQILFSQVEKEDGFQWVNWVYFGCATFSFGFGIATIVLSSVIAMGCVCLRSNEDRNEFAVIVKQPTKMLLFFYSTSLFLWMISFIGLGHINHPEAGFSSFIWGFVCLITVTAMLLRCQCIRDSCKTKEQKSKSRSQGASVLRLQRTVSVFLFGKDGNLVDFVPFCSLVLARFIHTWWQPARLILQICVHPYFWECTSRSAFDSPSSGRERDRPSSIPITLPLVTWLENYADRGYQRAAGCVGLDRRVVGRGL
jgi:hypothetical protein